MGAIAAGVLAASALTGVAIAASATADDDTGTSQGRSGEGVEKHSGRPGPGGAGGPGRGGHGPGMGPDGGMLHGEVVVETSEGVYETKQIQRGEVTAVSATSITIVSEDGFSATYAIDADTESMRDREEGAARVGDTAHVDAVVDGSSATAERIHAMSPEAVAEMEERRAEMEEWMSQRPEGPRDEGPGGMRGPRGPGASDAAVDAA